MTIPNFQAGQILTAVELNSALSDTASQALSEVQSNPNAFTEPQTFEGAITQVAGAGANNQSPFAQYGDFLSDFVVNGLSVEVPSPSSLTATLSTGTAVVLGQRTVVDSIPNATNTYAASSDTYISLSQSGVVAYTAVANGATAPAPASDAINILKVVTGPIVSPTPTLSAGTSGTLAAGTYQVALVAYDNTGYGAVSASESVTVPANGSIGISWPNPLNETSMSIYVTAEGGTTLGLVESGVTGTSYTYTGSVAPGAATPSGATSNAVQYADNIIPSQSSIVEGYPILDVFGDITLSRDDSGKLINYAGNQSGQIILPRSQSEPEGSMVFVFTNASNNLLLLGFQEGDGTDLFMSVIFPLQQVSLVNVGNLWRTLFRQNSSLSVFTLPSSSPLALYPDSTGTQYAPGMAINANQNGGSGLLLSGLMQLRDIYINGFTVNGLEIQGVDTAVSQVTSIAPNMNADGVGNNLVLSGNVQGLIISDSEFLGGLNGMEVTPVSTSLPVTTTYNGPAFNRFSNVYFDSSGNGANIDWQSDTIYTACWFANRPGNGATVGKNYSSGIQFIGSTFENCGSHGLEIDSGAVNTSVIGCIVKGNNAENNGSYGIYVADNTKGFIISNNTITGLLGYPGVQAAAIYIGTGCDDYVIEGNYVLGNSATIIDNSAATATNRIVRGNIGYTDNYFRGVNFLPNSSFLYGFACWDTPPSGFSLGTLGGFPCAKYNGSVTTQLEFNSNHLQPDWLEAGVIVTLSGILNNSIASGNLILVLNCFDSSEAYIENICISPIASGQGSTYVSSSGTIPANTSYIVVQVLLQGASSGSNISFSKLKLEIGPASTEWDDFASSQLFQNGQFSPEFGSVSCSNSSTLTGTTSGTITSSMPEQGVAKKFMAYANAYENDTTTAQTITFPTAFNNTPVITTNTSGLTLTVSTTELTITAPDNSTAYSGLIIVEGF